ncbi:MAG TPA: Holliday junction branch migration DNA helicase RuvB [Planctomycetota bacterium]|nr:Holliday junction branch migration DNA helicase RuvB [Planctomycetota bacterium]
MPAPSASNAPVPAGSPGRRARGPAAARLGRRSEKLDAQDSAERIEIAEVAPLPDDVDDLPETDAADETDVEAAASVALTQPVEANEDAEPERAMRPKSFADFIGQARALRNLRVAVKAALQREEALDHILLSGPPGLGKTTLAEIVAAELGKRCLRTSAPSIERGGDLVGLLTECQPGDVLFIDEVHRLRPQFEELLYSAMEDYIIDIRIGQGPGSKTVPIPVQPFTLIGATTREGLLSRPFLDRFGIPIKLEYYSAAEMSEILLRDAELLQVPIANDAALEVGRRSRYTPRIAIRLLMRLRDFALVEGDGKISLKLARHALDDLAVDQHGLNDIDRKILRSLADHGDQAVGLKQIAAVVGEEPDTIEEVYEPFLLREGFLLRTPRGRLATAKAFKLLGESLKNPGLFSEK